LSSFSVVALNEVWAMLDHCAPGWSKRATLHYWRVTLGTQTYATLPLGPHGARKNVEIEAGHVRRMARFLNIEACCKEFFDW
jgi:hypothetical protein